MYVNMFNFIQLIIHIEIGAAGVVACVQQVCYVVYDLCAILCTTCVL